ncbi:calcium/proton exchanger [Candidatus Woesearchaeota archaeon]|nr:calcium/proton exchanger [Candidatus Woesearchaeota archaeon]
MHRLLTKIPNVERFFYVLLAFIPVSLFFGFFTNNLTLIFITSVVAIIPLARILGFATEQLAMQSNPAISGLLSATFGNIVELMIAIMALRQGLLRIVEASIVGSIIGNLLLLIGLSIFIGGLRHKHQKFNKEAIGVSSTMLIIMIVALSIPSVYSFINPTTTHIPVLSNAVVVVMALIYIAGLFFSLKTHRDLFDASDEIRRTQRAPTLKKSMASLILLIATLIVALESSFLVKGVEHAAVNIGLTETFIGVVIIAIITNIAEKSVAIHFALENHLDVSLEIGLSSAIQIALFVVPILVLVSQIFGFGFYLVFSLFEIVAILFSVMIVNHLSSDGKCNWLEGAQMMAVYLIIAIAFFFV